jgi:hypothetical protein
LKFSGGLKVLGLNQSSMLRATPGLRLLRIGFQGAQAGTVQQDLVIQASDIGFIQS